MKVLHSKKGIPKPTLTRLCKMYSLFEELEESGDITISSKKIGQRLGVGSHNIRKDISYIGEAGTTGSGYDILKLKEQIQTKLGLEQEHNACVIGLGRLGMAIMNEEIPLTQNFKIVAGFDVNINRVETVKTSIPVFPTYEMDAIIPKKAIELALITIPGGYLHEILQRLIKSGIKGIVNLTSMLLNYENENVYISNIDLVGELRYLSAQFNVHR